MTWILVLLVLGAIFLLAEIILPGGIAGAIGFLFLAIAAFATWAEFGHGPGLAAVGLIVLGGVLFFRLEIGLIQHSKVGRKLTLQGGVANAAVEPLPEDLVGERGVVLSPLTPLGKIRVLEKTYEALSLSGRLLPGTEVEVSRVGDYALEVRRVE